MKVHQRYEAGPHWQLYPRVFKWKILNNSNHELMATTKQKTAKSCLCASPQVQSCLLRSLIQRVNGSLGSVMSEPNVTSSSIPSLPEAVADIDLRWHNTVLTQARTENMVWVASNFPLTFFQHTLLSMFVIKLWWFGFISLLWQEVSNKNHQISMLELQKEALLEELDDLQPHWLHVHPPTDF